MNTCEFLSATVCCMGQASLDLLKFMLLDRYIQFSYINGDGITNVTLAEKLLDYFEKVNIKTSRSFDDCISSYMANLNSIVEPRISKSALNDDGGSEATISRARKYYERCTVLRSSSEITIDDLYDFSRIMLCLYESILENELNQIDNFDYDRDSIDPVAIIESMLAEETRGLFLLAVSKRFDIRDSYGMDTCTIVLTIIMLSIVIYGDYKGSGSNE